MSEIRDLLGRITTTNVALGELTQQVMAASKAMGDAVKFMGKPGDAPKDTSAVSVAVEKLVGEISKLSPNIVEQIEQGKRTVESIEKLSDEIRDQKKDIESRSKKETSAESKMTEAIEKASKKIEDFGSKFSDAASKLELAMGSRAMEGTPGDAGKSGGGGGGKGGGGKGAPPTPGGPGWSDDDFAKLGEDGAKVFSDAFTEKSRKRMASWLTEISSLLLGGMGDVSQVLFAGVVRDATDFRKEARRLAFELDGINSSTRGLQAEFAGLGDVARQTGKSLDVMQKLYMANMRKGFKRQGHELKNVLKSGMHLSTMIGSNVDETGTMFADWNRMLGMSVDMMSQLATDAKGIARSTGVTGDELLQAMRSSEGILKNLRNQGNLTSTAAKNVIEAMTVAKKLGIEDKAAGVLDMMTSTNKFLEGDARTQAFIIKMAGSTPGGTDAAFNADIMNDPKMLKGFVNEMNKTISDFTGGQAKTVDEMDKLSKDDKARLSIILSKTFGMEMYEFKSMFEALNEQSKTLEDKFRTLEDEAGNVNESMEKRNLAEQKIRDLMIASGMSFANKFTEQARKVTKDGKSFEDVMKDVSKSMTDAERQDMDTMMKKAGIDQSKTAGLNESRDYVNSLLVAAEAMKKKGSDVGVDVKDFGPELIKAAEKAQSGGGSGDLVALVDEMNKVGNEIDVAAKKSSDPIDALTQQMTKLNQTIRENLSGPIGLLIDTLGWVGLALIQVGITSGLLYSRFGDLTTKIAGYMGVFSNVGGNIKSFLDKISGTKTAIPAGSYGPVLETSNMFSRMADSIAYGFGRIADVYDIFLNFLYSIPTNILKAGRNIGNGFRYILDSLHWFGRVGIFKVGHSIGNGFRYILDSLHWFGRVGIFKALNSVGLLGVTRNIKGSFDMIRGGIGLLLNPFRLLQKGFSGLSSVVKKIPIIGWLFMAVDGVIGAVEGYKKAGDIFGVKTDQLTTSMKISAGAAGATVGVLDGLTFGLLRASGAAGPLTEFLAKLYYGFAFLADGVQKGFMSWMPAIQDSFKSLGDALGELWAMFAGIFGYDVSSSSASWQSFYDMMSNVGWVIGQIVGGGLKLFVDVLYAIAQVVKAVVWYFSMLVEGFRALWTAITTFSFQPIINFFGKLGTDILSALGKVFSDLSSWIGSWFGWGKKTAPSPPATSTAPAATPQTALAEGGVTTGPTNALIGEAGPEAVIPLDRLDSMMGKENKVASMDFAKEKMLGSQKVLQESSRSSNNHLKNIDRVIKRGGNASDGIFVQDTRSGLMLSMIFNHMDMALERLDSMINFMSGDDPEKMKVAQASAKLGRVDRMTQAAGQYAEGFDQSKDVGASMVDQAYMALNSSATGRMGLGDENAAKYAEDRAKAEQKSLRVLKAIGRSNKEFTDEATTPGSIYVHDTHLEKKIDQLPGYSGTKDPADEQNWQNLSGDLEFMMNTEDRVAKAMHEQMEAYNSSGDFSESAAKASVEGLKDRGIESIQYEGGVKSIESAMEEANASLEKAARDRYMEDNKGELDALDKSISQLHKQVMDESKIRGNENKSIRDMPSYKALSDAHVRKSQILNAETPEKYYRENTMMAAPGEDPSMLYESRGEAINRAEIQRAKNVEVKQDAVAALEKELADIQNELNKPIDSRGMSAGEYRSEIDRRQGMERRMADIKGTSDNILPDWMTGGAQGTRGIVYQGELAAAKSNLEISKRELDPSTVERQTIGKNEWTGNSDTTVMFPEKYAKEAVDFHMESGKRTIHNADGSIQTKDSPEYRHQVSIEPEANMIPAEHPFDAHHILNEGPDTEMQAFAERKINGLGEQDIGLAEEMASIEAKARLIGKLGNPNVRELSGLEVETNVDPEGKSVSAFASWSKESEKAALEMRKSMEDTGAAWGGRGRVDISPPASTGTEISASDAILDQNMEQTKKLGTMEESAAKSLEPGSIYTHDIHLEKLLSGEGKAKSTPGSVTNEWQKLASPIAQNINPDKLFSGIMNSDKIKRAAETTASAIEQTSSYHATPVGQHAIPAMREDEEGVSNVQPVHLRDIADSILRDKTGGESGAGKLQSDELTRMEEVANKQYTEMQQIREGIQEMVRILKPSSEKVSGGVDHDPRTSFARKHVNPSIFGQMRDGKPGSGPNRSVYKGPK